MNKVLIINAHEPYPFSEGRLCDGDGRTRKDPATAFDNPEQDFFEGKGHDELFRPPHLDFKFFGMNPLETFACYDVLKNPDVENDFNRFEDHLDSRFPAVAC